MTDSSAPPTAVQNFRKWMQCVHDGTPAPTSLIESADPDEAAPLHRLIHNYLTDQATIIEGEAVSAAAEPEPLPHIPGYTILEPLGRGGMGEVFRVRDPLGREYALKVARRKQLSPAGRERFLAEARGMAELDHPHLAKVHHYDENLDRPYFLMGLYPATLADRAKDYHDPPAAVRLMSAVADGLGHLHARGYVHRDLKPSNILLAKDGSPVVSDFGLLKGPTDSDGASHGSGDPPSGETHATGARRSQTLAGLVLGTRRYMAPDQAAGQNHLAGPAWDVWALGVMLHELLTGLPPRSSAAPERLLDPVEPDNPPPTRIKPDLDPRLGRIIAKCLARDPSARYPSGSAVAADLNHWLKRGRRRWPMVAAGVLGVLLVGALGVALGWPRKPAEPTREEVLADIQGQLRDGKTVELIGETGWPKWFEVVADGGGQKPYLSEIDGTFQVNTTEVVLIDLPPTGLEQYRFEVEVRQFGAAAAPGQFGSYAGRHTLPTTMNEPVDCFASVWFNEGVFGRSDPAKSPDRWYLGVRSHKWVSGSGAAIGQRTLTSGHYTWKSDARNNEWHTLSVTFAPGRMDWAFDGSQPASATLPLDPPFEDEFATGAKLPAGVRSAFGPAGGYGLFVKSGTAGFRNARVIPTGP